MAKKEDVDRVIEQIVKILYDVGANNWKMQDKGALLAAVKLQLKESGEPPQEPPE